jgi:outer membrane protein assembly factor BamB
LLWSKDTAQENEARLPDWGFAGSPLVFDERVLVSVGGSNGRSLVAYAAADGHQVWAGGDGGSDYSSPIEVTLLGKRQILLFAGAIVSRDLEGRQLWSYPWPGGHPHITPPLIVGTNQFFATSGYGTGCELVTLQTNAQGEWNAAREWKTLALKSKFGPVFRVAQHVYGLDDGIFCCVDLKTGQRVWKDGRYGHGQGLLVGTHILLTSEKGDVVLIRPNPEKLDEVARYHVFDDKTWNPPALAGAYLLMRNDKEAACLRLTLNNLPSATLARDRADVRQPAAP